jgi:predicted transcriptional regulator
LTPENRRLLAMIRDGKPQSVAELSAWIGRAEPNLLRTLEKLRAAGLVRIEQADRRKVPMAAVGRIVVENRPLFRERPDVRRTGMRERLYNASDLRSAGFNRWL